MKEGGGASIGLVTDTYTGEANGYISAGEDILIEGTKIKVAGDDPSCGVYFINRDDDTSYKVERRLTQNDPSRIIARVPAELAPGAYTLRIITQFSNSTQLLKEPRTLEYELPLGVG